MWLEAHPDSKLRDHMPYYLESENPAPPPNPDLTPESLSVMDPACGSGHILVYAFDLLAHIYRERGYAERDIPALILEHNLHGLDIDERAAQLASFAVVMKARDLNSRLFRRDMPALNILQVRPTRGLALPNAGGRDMLGHYSTLSGGLNDADTLNPNDWQPLLDAFADADHLGSLITPPSFDAGRLRAQLRWLEERGGLDAGALDDLRHLLKQAELLARKYDAVVANPPYMGEISFNEIVRDYIKSQYVKSKSDLNSVFLERNFKMLNEYSKLSMVNQHAWMFLGSYEAMRKDVLNNSSIINLLHLGARAFPELGGEVVQTVAFVLVNKPLKLSKAKYLRLTEFKDNSKEEAFFKLKNSPYIFVQDSFLKIPGSPLAYWVTDNIANCFSEMSPFIDKVRPRQGMATTNNDRFLRQWQEVAYRDVGMNQKNLAEAALSQYIWFPYNKGGEFRRWYGNLGFVVNFKFGGEEICQYIDATSKVSSSGRIINRQSYFLESVSWSDISTSSPSFRFYPQGCIFDSTGPSCFPSNRHMGKTVLSMLNSKPVEEFLKILAPNMHFREGPIGRIPIPENSEPPNIEVIIQISKTDWDNFETSWDFTIHPLLRPGAATAADAFAAWQATAEAAFRELQRLEQENNRYWIDAYGLQDELTPEVPDEQITIRRADLGRDVRSLLSYAVGCMMGRYSLDAPGLIHAGGAFDPARHTRFAADRDGILPVTLDGYFDDDVTARLAEFLRVAFAPETAAQNMEWIAAGLGGQKAGESAEARIRRYFAAEFMSDHLQTYKKRPIYWLFTSGKKRGFGALVYLHRYDAGTLARLRTDYLMPLQRTLDAELERAAGERDTAGSTALKKVAERRVKDLSEQIAEVHRYDESLKHAADLKISLDLDDGVAYNYWLMGAAGQEYLTGKSLKGLQDLVYTGTDLKLADLERKSQWKRDLLAGALAQEQTPERV